MTDYVTIKRSEIDALPVLINYADDGTTFHSIAVNDIRALLEKVPSVEPACDVEGTWLWLKLMDYCRNRRIAPATQDDLFAIVVEARKLYTSPPQAEARSAELEKTNE